MATECRRTKRVNKQRLVRLLTVTTVCKIDKSGEFVRMWEGYSATTMRHINAFIEMFGISGGGKKWWDALPVEEKPHGGADMTPAESLKAMYARRAANY